MGPLNRRQMVKDRVYRTHVLGNATAVKLDACPPSKKTIARAHRASRAQSATLSTSLPQAR